jgi:hypothetical protein
MELRVVARTHPRFGGEGEGPGKGERGYGAGSGDHPGAMRGGFSRTGKIFVSHLDSTDLVDSTGDGRGSS